MKTKRKYLVIVVLVTALLSGMPLYAAESESSVTASLSWDLGLKACYEHRFDGHLGLKAGMGINLLFPPFIAGGEVMLVQDALAIIHFTDMYKPFQAGVGVGIPVSTMLWYTHEDTGERLYSIMFAPGCSFLTGYRSPGGISYRIWFGAGYPIIYDAGEWRSGVNMPLNVWWDLDLEVVFPLRQG